MRNAYPHKLNMDDMETRDHYASRGVALDRDAAHLVVAALRRDAYDLRSRPHEANIAAAAQQEELATSISYILSKS